MKKTFYVIEARDIKTKLLEKKMLYTTKAMYETKGKENIDKLRKIYNVKVIKYFCYAEEVIKLNKN
jgi:hypothetical protein